MNLVLLLVLVAAVGCGDDDDADDSSDGGSSSGSGGASGSAGDDAGMDGGDEAGSAGRGGGGGGPPPTCGDCEVQEPEECDDCNDDDNDGCTRMCEFTCSEDEDCDDDKMCNGTETCDDHKCSPGSDAPDDEPCGTSDSHTFCRDGECVLICLDGNPAPEAGCPGCEEGTQDCGDNADCVDRDFGWECVCNQGYAGDGQSCEDIDECAEGSDECDPVAECHNTEGDYECECPEELNTDGRKCFCDLSGYWGMRQEATIEWLPAEIADVTILEGGTLDTTAWELHKYTYDGTTLEVEKKPCGTDRQPDIRSPFYGETYSSFVPFDAYDRFDLSQGVDVPLDAAKPDTDFTTPREAAVVGIVLDDPLYDEWPRDRTRVEQWDDPDGDGQPGLTAWQAGTLDEPATSDPDYPPTYDYTPVIFDLETETLDIIERAACVSTAARVITTVEGTVESCDRITGAITGEPAQARVHSCILVPEDDWDDVNVTCDADVWRDGEPCDNAAVTFLDLQEPQNASHASFELHKLGDLTATDITCETVRETLPAQ